MRSRSTKYNQAKVAGLLAKLQQEHLTQAGRSYLSSLNTELHLGAAAADAEVRNLLVGLHVYLNALLVLPYFSLGFYSYNDPSVQTLAPKDTAKTATAPVCRHKRGLWEADNNENAHRAVGRLLCAGTDYIYHEGPKMDNLKEFQLLFGGYYDISTFPVKGGRRLVIAGQCWQVADTAAGVLYTLVHKIYGRLCVVAVVLSKMLCREVSLENIRKWFPTINAQKLVIHEELASQLQQRNMTWPPNAACFGQCESYHRNLGEHMFR